MKRPLAQILFAAFALILSSVVPGLAHAASCPLPASFPAAPASGVQSWTGTITTSYTGPTDKSATVVLWKEACASSGYDPILYMRVTAAAGTPYVCYNQFRLVDWNTQYEPLLMTSNGINFCDTLGAATTLVVQSSAINLSQPNTLLHSFNGTYPTTIQIGAAIGASSTSATVKQRDAIYLYGQDFLSGGQKQLVGVNCDAFQLVLNVKSGQTGLTMNQSSALTTSGAQQYPDAIQSGTDIFAYILSDPSTYKTFTFNDKSNPTGNTKIGTGTAFAYCISSRSDAYVYLVETDKCTNKYSNGSITAISGCTP